MATPDQIREKLIGIAAAYGPAVSNIAIVKSVNEAEATCVLEDEDGQEYLDVRLHPVLSGNKSFIQIPKAGTFVLALRIEDDDEWIVIACDQVDKFLWVSGKSSLEVSDKIHIEANGYSLITLLQRLFTVIEKGYTTNNGPTIKLISQSEFISIKNDFKKLLK